MPFHPRDADARLCAARIRARASVTRPTEFTQVNPAINRVLVRRAIAAARPAAGRARRRFLLRPRQFHAADRAARRARRRRRRQRGTGPPRRAKRARSTASRTARRFAVANLFAATPESIEALGPLDKALIDPPREGAIALVKALPPATERRARIVYVSCNPATLARDAGGARQRARLRARRRRRDQHVPAHGARRVDRAVRALSDTASVLVEVALVDPRHLDRLEDLLAAVLRVVVEARQRAAPSCAGR